MDEKFKYDESLAYYFAKEDAEFFVKFLKINDSKMLS